MLLLEAGSPDYRFDFRTQMPAALAFPLQGKRYNWAYETEPEPFMNNRRMECGRGKGLGGSSLINGMCYIRGNALDLDNSAQEPGLENWSYLDCLHLTPQGPDSRCGRERLPRWRWPGERHHLQTRRQSAV
ncbi:GMC family oxidoreductase N-terminal domain-containing protein [Escherichia coli]